MKYTLADAELNEYTAVRHRGTEAEWQVPPEEVALEVLKALKADSATGPDLVPTRALKECEKSWLNHYYCLREEC